MRIRTSVLLTAVVLALVVAPSAAAVPSAEARKELERIEDLRLLHRYAIEDLHDAKALSLYLRGWGGPARTLDVEELLREAEDVYGLLRGVDYGATALQAEIDVLGEGSPSAEQLTLLQRARGEVAARVNDFHRRSAGLKAELAKQVTAAARRKTTWQLVSRPQPWADPAKEAGRKDALPFGYTLREPFFKLPAAEGDYALGKARKAGLSYCQVSWAAVCDWSAMEPEPGRYTFAALDAVLARLGRAGMKVCLMLHSLTGEPPAWHAKKFGADCRFTVAKVGQGKTHSGINLFHGPTGQAYGRFLAAYAAHLKAKFPAAVDAVYVDAGHEIGAVADESKAMDAFWRKWSKSQTPWRTPEAIRAAKPTDEAALAQAEACRETWLLEYIARVSGALKKGWPGLTVQIATVNHDMHRIGHHTEAKSRDVYRLAAWSPNPNTGATSPASLAILRSFAGGRWLWHYFMPIGCGTKTGACNAQAPFFDVARIAYNSGPGGFDRHNFPAGWFRYSDWQLGDFGIGSYFLTPRRCQELAPVILNTAAAPATVTVLWSQTTLRRDPSYELHKAAIAWAHLLGRAFVNFDYLPEADLGARLKPYKVLILPNTQSMTEAACAAIRQWVRAGGTLLGFGAPGLYDERGRRRGALPLADVFGADVAAMRVPAPITPDKLFTGHPEGPFQEGNKPPAPYMFGTNLTAALKVTTAKPRAWFAGAERDVAIAENAFGAGRSLLCGYPVGTLYWETAPYELVFGPTHHRLTSYNQEQNHYEAWIAREMEKLGVVREAVATRGVFLRAQKTDDPEWSHTFRFSPTYAEYMYETDAPARSVLTFVRKRDGVDNVYVGLVNSEMNYFLERGYFVSILTGGEATAAVVLPKPAAAGTGARPIVFDARLGVPVPSSVHGGRVTFTTWLPIASSGAFAVAPGGKVRLFGAPSPSGDGPEAIARRTAAYAGGKKLAEVEILDADRIAAFLAARRGKQVRIACGDTRYKAAAEALSAWLKAAHEIEPTVTNVGSRISCRWAYQDGFGYVAGGREEAPADILIGNCRDNGLMWRYTWIWGAGDRSWLPLEINTTFPGPGRAVVMLSSPIATDGSGKAVGKKADQRLVIGASFPTEALRAVKALAKAK